MVSNGVGNRFSYFVCTSFIRGECLGSCAGNLSAGTRNTRDSFSHSNRVLLFEEDEERGKRRTKRIRRETGGICFTMSSDSDNGTPRTVKLLRH